jgi:hypothetical protein
MGRDEKQKPAFTFNKGRVVNAIYRTPDIDSYTNNPLILALPGMLPEEQVMSRLGFYPQYDDSHRNAPDRIRYLLIQNAMWRFFAALNVHVDLERRYACLIRSGYVGRNPLEINFWNEVAHKLDEFDQYTNGYDAAQHDGSITAGFNMIGMSGVGKSRSVLRVLNLYPQVIHHNNFQERNFTHSQIVWLKLDCPFDGNPRGLCNEFFKSVDRILHTSYYKAYASKRRLQDDVLSDMATVCANQLLGVLVIDEIQRLSLARSGGAEKMLNFFVQLINTIGVPVALIGTYKALSVLSGEFSQMRRGTGQGDLVWDRMAKDDQWELFTESLWRFQYTRQKCELKEDAELSETLYDESQGITDLAIKIYMFAQERAIDSGKEMVTPAVIRSAARDKIKIPREILNALRFGDKRVLELFEDVYPAALKKYLVPLPENVSGKIKEYPEIEAILRQSPEHQSEHDSDSEQPVQAGPSSESSIGEHNAFKKEPSKKRSSSKRKRESGVATSVTGKLPQLIAQLESKDGTSVYEALKDAGYVRASNEYL